MLASSVGAPSSELLPLVQTMASIVPFCVGVPSALGIFMRLPGGKGYRLGFFVLRRKPATITLS